MNKCKYGAWIGGGVSDTCGQCKTDKDEKSKDQRIKKLESTMQEFIERIKETDKFEENTPEMAQARCEVAIMGYVGFNQLLNDGK